MCILELCQLILEPKPKNKEHSTDISLFDNNQTFINMCDH